MKNLKESILDINDNIDKAVEQLSSVEPFYMLAQSLFSMTDEEELDKSSSKVRRRGMKVIDNSGFNSPQAWGKLYDDICAKLEKEIKRKECLDMFGTPIHVGDFAFLLGSNAMKMLIRVDKIYKNLGRSKLKYSQIDYISTDCKHIDVRPAPFNCYTDAVCVIPKNKLNDFVTKFNLSWL